MKKTGKGSIVICTLLTLILTGAGFSGESSASLLRDGRLALDTGRFKEAATLLEQAAADSAIVEEVAPDRAWTYICLGNKSLGARRYEEAESYYSLAAAIYPGFKKEIISQWTFVKLNVITTRIQKAQDEKRDEDWPSLTGQVQWIIGESPRNLNAYYTMGILLELQNDADAAKANYVRAINRRWATTAKPVDELRLAAQKRVAGKTYKFDLKPVYPPWREIKHTAFREYRRRPFIIFHRNEELAVRVAGALEYYMDIPIMDGFIEANGAFPTECKVRIYADEGEFQEAGGMQVWAGGQSRFQFVNDKLTYVSINLFQTSPDLTENALPHELAHVRLIAEMRFAEGLPLWLQEGIATTTETDDKKQSYLKALIKARSNGDLPAFEKLSNSKSYPDNISNKMFYATSLAAVEALFENSGKRRLRKYIDALQSNNPDEALYDAFSLNSRGVDSLISDWIARQETEGR